MDKYKLNKTTGGIQINGLGATDIDNQAEFQNSTTLGGLNIEFHERISRHYGRLERLDEVVKKKLKDPDAWRFEARVAEQIIRDWLAENPSITVIKVCLPRSVRLTITDNVVKSRLVDNDAVEKDGSVIGAIHLTNGQKITGKVSDRVVQPRAQLTHILRLSLKQLTKETY